MDTALAYKLPFILDRNLAKANCTGNHVCTSCDRVVLALMLNLFLPILMLNLKVNLKYMNKMSIKKIYVMYCR